MSRLSRRNLVVGGTVVALVVAAGIYMVVEQGWFTGGCEDTGTEPAVDSYEVKKIDGDHESAQALSPNGKYSIGIDREMDAPGEEEAVLREDGDIAERDFGGSSLEGSIEVFAVNNSGDAVGGFDDLETDGWAIVDGETLKLRGPDGSVNVEPKAIAGDGTIVGYFGSSKSNRIPAKWAPGEIKATKLETPDGLHGKATGIAEDGTIVGSLYDGEHPGKSKSTYAWVWDPDGSGQKLSDVADFAVEGKAQKSWAVDLTCDWVLIDTGPGFVRVDLNGGDAEPIEGIADHYPDEPRQTVPGIDGYGRVFGAKAVDDDYGPGGIFDDGFSALPGLDDPDVATKIVDVSQDGCVVLGRHSMLTCA